MSIIIAKIDNNSCLFKSDTKVSIDNGDKSVTGGNKLRLPPNEGVLKIHIPYKKICIAFAGTVSVCSDIIHNFCNKQPEKITDILQFLQQKLIEKNDDSAFIVGLVVNSKPILFKVDQKNIESGDSFWIGEKDAFNEFQSIFLNENSNKSLLDKFNFAFNEMIKNSNVPTIGDFTISAAFRKKYESFVYEETLESRSGYGKITIKESEKKILSEGTVQEGAFTTTNLISNDTAKQAVCIYFQKGGRAYLYFPLSIINKSAKPIQLSAQNIEELKKIVLEEYKIELIGFSFNLGNIRFVE